MHDSCMRSGYRGDGAERYRLRTRGISEAAAVPVGLQLSFPFGKHNFSASSSSDGPVFTVRDSKQGGLWSAQPAAERRAAGATCLGELATALEQHCGGGSSISGPAVWGYGGPQRSVRALFDKFCQPVAAQPLGAASFAALRQAAEPPMSFSPWRLTDSHDGGLVLSLAKPPGVGDAAGRTERAISVSPDGSWAATALDCAVPAAAFAAAGLPASISTAAELQVTLSRVAFVT